MRRTNLRSITVMSLLAVGGFFIGRACRTDTPRDLTTDAPASVAGEYAVWTCVMHPQVRRSEPGLCPVCSMELIQVAPEEAEPLGPRVLKMTPRALALAEIETAPVERRDVAREVRMVGKVAYDETRLSYIASRVPGRMDELFVDYTGVSVRAGDHLARIYSPTLYSAQQELLQAIKTAKKLEQSSLEILRSTSDATVNSAKEKLRLYGFTPGQIEELIARDSPEEHVTIYAPIGGVVVHKMALEGMYVSEGAEIYTIADLSKVWVLLEAYESDLAWLRFGQAVSFTVEAYPGRTFQGRVAFIDPALDSRTRTIKVRLSVDNSDSRLKPDMFVSALVHSVLTPDGQVVDEDLASKWLCPMHPEIVSEGPSPCSECGMDMLSAREMGFVAETGMAAPLVIPSTAPLITGKRAVVYVRSPASEEPRFEGRVVTLGPRAGDWYVVEDGLEEGELVVVRGNFKIDSELQIRAGVSMMSPLEEESHHASHSGAVHAAAPREFRRQLGVLLDRYLDLHAALSSDRDGRPEGLVLQTALRALDVDLLQGATLEAWMESRASLIEAVAGVAEAEDLAARRSGLGPLTRELVELLEHFGFIRDAGPAARVALFHCPMAPGEDGADWIQTDGELANPYFGSAMLSCGSRTRSLEEEL